MHRFRSAIAALIVSAAVPSLVVADPFDPRQIPADVKWVVHINMDVAHSSKTWEIINDKLQDNDNFQSSVKQVEQLTDMRFPEDLHDATLYGRAAGDEAGVVVVHARINRSKTMTVLQLNDGFASNPYSTYEILTWDDKGKKMFGTFHDDSTVIIGRSEANIEAAVDVMDGKAPSIKPDSPMATGTGPQLLAFASATDLASLKKSGEAPSPLVQQVQNAWISLTEKDDDAVVQANLFTKDADTAKQLDVALEGLRAMAGLFAGAPGQDAHSRGKAGAIAALVKTGAIKQNQSTVEINWPIAIEQAKQALDALSNQTATTQP